MNVECTVASQYAVHTRKDQKADSEAGCWKFMKIDAQRIEWNFALYAQDSMVMVMEMVMVMQMVMVMVIVMVSVTI